MTTEHAPWTMDSGLMQPMSRRRFWNVAATVAAVAYSISYLGTLAVLKVSREAAADATSEVAVVAEAPATAAREATSAPAAEPAPVPTEAAAATAGPRSNTKPAVKAWTNRETTSTPATVAASSITSGPGINVEAASTALVIAARRAGKCLEAGDARTSMSVKVTFAGTGRVTTALVNGGPFMGTPEGSCIARALRSATVGPFDGGPVTVTRTVRVR